MVTKESGMLQNQIAKKIALIVEDEPAISRACQRVLMTEGFEVDIAMNGLIAIQMVNAKNYDLCLSDVCMPGMSGIELYRYLEEVRPDLANKMVFTTGDVLNRTTSEFLKEVKRPVLTKPFTLDELIKVIRVSYNEVTSGSQ
jgi:two-component system NtrC family sensor kinase